MATPLDDGLSCPVCVEYFENPKQLTCGHTFCKNCLIKVYRSQACRELPCPMCRQVSLVPEGDVSTLPTNITVKGLVEDLQSATYTCTANCEASDRSPAMSYCQTCGEFMCQSCHDLHGKWKKNADHDVASADEIREGTMRIKQKCKKHPRDMQDNVCKTCMKRVCFKCRMLKCDKAGHEVFEDVEYMEIVRDNIKDLSRRAEAKLASIVKHAESVNEQKKKVEEAISACRFGIERAHYEAVLKLAEKRSALLRTCDSHKLAQLEKLDKIAEKDDELASILSNAHELVCNGMKDIGTGHMMKVHAAFCGKLDNLLKTDVLIYQMLPRSLHVRRCYNSFKNRSILILGKCRWSSGKQKYVSNSPNKIICVAQPPQWTGGWPLDFVWEESRFILPQASCSRQC